MADNVTTVSPSVLKGLITSEGLANCIRMANNGGWHIYPTKFCVSDVIGEIDATRTTLDMFETWYEAPISGRIVQNSETIEFLCTIPPGASADTRYIREIYLLAETTDGAQFLLGLCGIDGTAVYDPAGSIKFRIIVSIQNLNLMNLFVFKYTQAAELEDHNNDPNAHPDLSAAIEGVGKPTIIYNNYTASAGQTLFVDTSSGPITIQLPRTGLKSGTKIEVIDVGWQCHIPGKEISIVSVDHTIDKRRAALILNQRGAAVRLLYWPNWKGWCLDIGGRFYADIDHEVDLEEKELLYTTYLGKTDVVNIGDPGEETVKIGDTVFVNTGDPLNPVENPPQYGIKLPANPAAGDRVTIIDSNGNFWRNPPKVDGNGHTISGSNDYYVLNQAFGKYDFYYDEFTKDWKVTLNSTKAGADGGLRGKRYDQVFWTNVPAQTVLTVPEYIVGSSFAVWLDGVLCKKGEGDDQTASYQEIGNEGETSTRFKFWNTIPAGMTITTLS